jgi:RNA polymerase sigma-70 factor (ECF subfamily)
LNPTHAASDLNHGDGSRPLESGVARDADTLRDQFLVLRCQRGEDPAFAELVRCWEGRLYYFIRRLVPREDDAGDVLQKTWMQVLRRIHRLNDPGAFRVWLFRIARSTAVSHFRREMAHRARWEPEADAEGVSDDEGPLRVENVEYLHHGLNRLSVPFREVLTLHFLEDMPVEEIGAVLGIPPGTVKSRLYYAKRALRGLLAEEMIHGRDRGGTQA